MTSAADSPSAVPGSPADWPPAVPGSPAAPARPTTVTVAFWFQVGLVAVLLILIGMSIAGAVHYNGLIDEAARATSADAEEVSLEREDNVAGTLFAAIPLLLLAIWLGITAIWVRRGSNIARILTWVGLGAPLLLGLGCCFFGFFAFAMFIPFDESFADDPEFADDPTMDFSDSPFYDKLFSLDSGGWSVAYDAVISTALGLALLFAVTVVVLLVVSPSNRYFRPLGRVAFGFPYGPMPGPYGYPGPVPGPYGYPGPVPYGYPGPPPAAFYGYPGVPPVPGPYGYAGPPPPFPPPMPPFPGPSQPFPAAPPWEQTPAQQAPAQSAPEASPAAEPSPEFPAAPPDQTPSPAQDR
ncbi:hypothetical protein KOI35_37770 [Actinoplanes bogorensis]|uniref:Uncharacterized protein n=1 Tax=Paractinoplanes bogorensis TaxID=1610840 RepID=A0ABS5Z1S5_9ACTN|nr:hypothetical protein [Actinoplanes bogorensis]MBU2669276.1 hypothetical protein [Actinoplanes bogorensis]